MRIRTALILLFVAGAFAPAFGQEILVYFTGTGGRDYVSQAAAAAGTATVTTSSGAFGAALAAPPGGGWDAVVIDFWTTAPTDANFTAVDAYLAGGGKVAMCSWHAFCCGGSGETSLLSTMGVTVVSQYNSPIDLNAWDGGHPVWTTPNTLTALTGGTDPGFGIDGNRANVTGSGVEIGGFTGSPAANQAGLIVTDDSVWAGPVLQAYSTGGQGVAMWENIIDYLLSGGAPPPPPAPASGSTALIITVIALGGGLALFSTSRRG